jgi:murein DD-endopeptidase MepM/ murein hydrolase activator NlpD
VAAHDGVVKSAGYSDGYGNYVVLGGKGTRFDFVYGHMKGRSRVGVKKRVHAGQRIGSVGSTGSDSGVCHLHFELWKGRWFSGGSRTDPLPHLRAWDKFSGGPLVIEPTPIGQDSASKRLFYDAAE